MKTINLDFTWSESSVTYEGGVVLEIGGRTPGNQSVKVKFTMGPSAIGYLADQLHKAVNKQQKRLDNVKARLRGNN